MRKSLRLRKKQALENTELYVMNLSTLRMAYKQQNIAFWMLCIYFFFEYVRPQNIYPVLNVLPWGLLSLSAASIAAFLDPNRTLGQ